MQNLQVTQTTQYQNQNPQQTRVQNPTAITQMANKIPIIHLKYGG